ncbi:hypothetical protein P168DRAFT_314013 [Aspergillus campestris IBT 28561]|uniref:Uncharacterized protein n=1 Tax=Aspergillus campestris (strain IBT 28561) TaxID=1392248 RepID=A0A2I1DDB8_ASPC2|nr:uncharacterized protein P168DRAFT_314013 [Aspergillus campestris IBT 28561]PKY07873.1 hypothetical protein P168DRAFT_314013 [Aspergillus campestris IBT 28561]
MQLTNTLFAVMAAALLVTAAPASESVERDLQARGCPDGFDTCGECNGTSCKIAGINFDCDFGKCTEQSGGGDGEICGYRNDDNQNGLWCPGGH